jgi:hypothetical protein
MFTKSGTRTFNGETAAEGYKLDAKEAFLLKGLTLKHYQGKLQQLNGDF